MEARKDDHRVLLDPLVYAKVKGIARIKGVTTEEWVNESLQKAVREAPEAMEATLRAIREGPEGDIPAVDIEQMLREIESGYRSL